MSRPPKRIVWFGTITLVTVLLYCSFTGCALSEDQSRSIVMAELARRGFDPALLVAEKRQPGDCSCGFEYIGKGVHIDYVVIDDVLHGPKLTEWDVKKHGL